MIIIVTTVILITKIMRISIAIVIRISSATITIHKIIINIIIPRVQLPNPLLHPAHRPPSNRHHIVPPSVHSIMDWTFIWNKRQPFLRRSIPMTSALLLRPYKIISKIAIQINCKNSQRPRRRRNHHHHRHRHRQHHSKRRQHRQQQLLPHTMQHSKHPHDIQCSTCIWSV